jgi:hypothetical protein
MNRLLYGEIFEFLWFLFCIKKNGKTSVWHYTIVIHEVQKKLITKAKIHHEVAEFWALYLM